GGDVEVVVGEVRRRQLLALRRGRLVLACRDANVEGGVAEAAVAGAVQSRLEREREHGARRRTRDRELRLDPRRHRQVALPAEFERLQLDLERFTVLLAWTELQPAQVEARHATSLARCDCTRAGRASS